ncbi:MAG: hypothetical protein L6408_07900 [Nanoarchaeota archaeon]|nr:hypothetical protein [Nanoarchaeota archaeon]
MKLPKTFVLNNKVLENKIQEFIDHDANVLNPSRKMEIYNYIKKTEDGLNFDLEGYCNPKRCEGIVKILLHFEYCTNTYNMGYTRVWESIYEDDYKENINYLSRGIVGFFEPGKFDPELMIPLAKRNMSRILSEIEAKGDFEEDIREYF